ncbi:hypothetical protein [uncultured Shewanella sp.]|uniref:hypothetical protein n=1 Tax=uncultured Shewanella sp. TaxID=173975 RepID=UPI00260BA9CF|nr:hypothetical protein [uncultured Shewanella sp.]
MSSVTTLLTFLLLVTSVTFGGLYFDTWQKNKSLNETVSQLKDSQVLLSVSAEQASVIAAWMNSHPAYVEGIIQQAQSYDVAPSTDPVVQPYYGEKKSQQKVIELNTAMDDAVETIEKKQNRLMYKETVIDESAEGVKTIALPHGGIRITTR